MPPNTVHSFPWCRKQRRWNENTISMLHHFNPFPLTHGFTNSRKTQFGEEESHKKYILRALRGGRICNRIAFNNLDSENAFVLCCGAQKNYSDSILTEISQVLKAPLFSSPPEINWKAPTCQVVFPPPASAKKRPLSGKDVLTLLAPLLGFTSSPDQVEWQGLVQLMQHSGAVNQLEIPLE